MKKNLWGIVKPLAQGENANTRAAQALFTQKDEQALGIIITSLDDSFIHYIDEAKTSNEAWGILERSFGAKAKHSRIALKMQLYGLNIEPGEDLSSLINRLKSIITQLTYIECQVEEEDKVVVLLKALPPSFDNIVTILKEKEPIPSLEDVTNSLQAEEKKQNGGTNKVKINGDVYVAHGNKSNFNNKKCFTCGSTSHMAKDCYKANHVKFVVGQIMLLNAAISKTGERQQI